MDYFPQFHSSDSVFEDCISQFVLIDHHSETVKPVQAFYTEMQTRLFAVCDTEAHLSGSHSNTLCKREISWWEFQSWSVISLSHHYLHVVVLNGTLCIGLILCSMQRFASAIQSSSKVHHYQVCCFLDLLAGRISFCSVIIFEINIILTSYDILSNNFEMRCSYV